MKEDLVVKTSKTLINITNDWIVLETPKEIANLLNEQKKFLIPEKIFLKNKENLIVVDSEGNDVEVMEFGKCFACLALRLVRGTRKENKDMETLFNPKFDLLSMKIYNDKICW